MILAQTIISILLYITHSQEVATYKHLRYLENTELSKEEIKLGITLRCFYLDPETLYLFDLRGLKRKAGER
jgi:hypothetical protein